MNKAAKFQRQYQIQMDLKTEPAWKNLVDKWYQLDSISYAISEVAHVLKSSGLDQGMDLLLLCSIGGSNRADMEFVESGYSSPAKFVYTLPNVALSPLCQVLKWQGQTRCVVCRETELDIVHREAAEIAEFEKKSVALFIVDQNTIGSYKKVEFLRYES